MSCTYKIKKANVSYKNGKRLNLQYILFILRNIMQKISVGTVFLLCAFFTYMIYNLYITEVSLENTITIGALLSTLGSSIVSVTSHTCNESFRCFEENLKTMQKKQEMFDAKWEHRPFYKRISRHKYAKNKFEYCFLINPQIEFSVHTWNKAIDIPSSKSDFYELPIIRNFLTLKKHRKPYRVAISLYKDEKVLKEILVWDNLTDLYKNIISFKISQSFSILGWSILVNSICFSFFYYYLPSILETFKTLSSQYLQFGPKLTP